MEKQEGYPPTGPPPAYPGGPPPQYGAPPPGAYPPPPMAPQAAGYPPPPGGVYPPLPAGAYPPPQPGMYPPPAPMQAIAAPGQNVTVIVQQPQLGFHSAIATCPHCKNSVQTRVEYETGGLTWIAVGALCLLGCWAGCCLIPCCINDCKDAIHHCPSCNKIIASKRRL